MNHNKSSVPALSRRAALIGAGKAMALLAAACAPLPVPPGATAKPTAASEPAAPLPSPVATRNTACLRTLPPVVRPTPIPYPGYTEVEPSTGLHVTAPPQVIELATYRLEVKGKVANELSLTYDELRCLPKISAHVVIECPGFFVDSSNLAGASLASVLALAGPLEGATTVQFTGVDGRSNGCPLAEAQGTDYFLAYEWEGELLPVSHGFPVRAALPNSSGGNWVKWLQEITVS